MISRVNTQDLFRLIESNLATLEYVTSLSRKVKSQIDRHIFICQKGVFLIPENERKKVHRVDGRLYDVVNNYNSNVNHWCIGVLKFGPPDYL